jgi:hypothetical protein
MRATFGLSGRLAPAEFHEFLSGDIADRPPLHQCSHALSVSFGGAGFLDIDPARSCGLDIDHMANGISYALRQRQAALRRNFGHDFARHCASGGLESDAT